MSAPLATPDDLGVYLGRTVDQARATLILQLAHDLCETVASPVPAAAKGVELAVASRAYNNVTSAHQAGVGSAQVSYGAPNSSTGIGGLYLSKSDRRTLRSLSGRTGAFSVDLLPAPLPPTAVPVLSDATPDGAAAGALVRLTGYGFTGTVAVTFDGTAAQFLAVDDTDLDVVVPAGTAGVVPVVVTNAVGASLPLSYLRG